jgi:hypothetical protein
MDDRIVPFGKHKGKPVEILATDKQYIEWLLAQSWFKEKYFNIYTVVINNFREPVDTPEHNKIQVKFLDFNYRLKLVYFLYPEIFERNIDYLNNSMLEWLNSENIELNVRNNFLDSLENPIKSERYGLYSTSLMWYSNPIFENVDVSFSISYGLKFYFDNSIKWVDYINRKTCEVKLEIKPTISDDFPSVLRQMKASMPISEDSYFVKKYYLLLIEQYTGIGATKSEFIEYFKTQGYIVVFEEEFVNIELPNYDKQFIIGNKLKEMIETK